MKHLVLTVLATAKVHGPPEGEAECGEMKLGIAGLLLLTSTNGAWIKSQDSQRQSIRGNIITRPLQLVQERESQRLIELHAPLWTYNALLHPVHASELQAPLN